MEGPTLTNPEGVTMIALSAFADFVPPIFILSLDVLIGAGEPVSWALDIFFTVVFGIWMWTRGGDILRKGKGGAKGKIKGKFMRFLKRRGLWMLGEYVPVLGSIAPFWLIGTILFLVQQNKPS